MKPKNIRLRMDRNNGDIWLVEERPNEPIKRLRNATDDVIRSLCADITAEEGTNKVIREMRFSDGMLIRLTVEAVTDENGPPAVGSA